MEAQHQQQLENILNKYGLKKLLEYISKILHVRAHHVATQYRDSEQARALKAAGDRILEVNKARFMRKLDYD